MRLIGLIVFIILSVSCDEKIFTGDVDCNECYAEKPEGVYLEIEVTLRAEFPEVPIVVYLGDIEEDQVEWIDTVYESPYYLYVEADRKYSVKAEYAREDATLYAVDGTKPKILRVTEACEFECYVIVDEMLDVTVKNDFLDF
jgi:hypothetical protein